MPPKKVAEVPKATTGDEGTPSKDLPIREGVNIEDLNLPKSIVTRLAKGVLPPNTQIQGNAMLAMTKSATVFVNYLASHGNDLAHRESRKTLASRDVLNALKDLEFPVEWQDRLEAELAKYTEIQNDKRTNYRKKVADKAESTQAGEGQDANNELGEGESQLDRDGPPPPKKSRLDGDSSTAPGMDTSEMQEGDHMGEHTADEDGDDDDNPPDEDDDEDDGGEERLEVEEQLEEAEEREAEDEALDNGEDSD